ncbi:MAG: hypothetical protein GWN07_18345, partial [Actinobacteria bacterium]|nr:hypothetical protein [Actinomycetota bacterium]NIX21692.1 hypothetical protein [Actinomycetota bacterium]
MRPRDRLAWGLVGALSFLVLVQGYELAVGLPVGLLPKLAVAALVGGVTVALVPAVERRLGA